MSSLFIFPLKGNNHYNLRNSKKINQIIPTSKSTASTTIGENSRLTTPSPIIDLPPRRLVDEIISLGAEGENSSDNNENELNSNNVLLEMKKNPPNKKNKRKRKYNKVKKYFPVKKKKVEYVKHYREDGRAVRFKVFKEKDLNINKFDDEIDIQSSEEDYGSDEDIIKHGKEKSEREMLEAFEFIKKNKLESFANYQMLFKKDKKMKKELNYIINKIPDLE